jgi:hypothetical protein
MDRCGLEVDDLRIGALDVARIMRQTRPVDATEEDVGDWEVSCIQIARAMGMNMHQRLAFYRLCGWLGWGE